MAEQKRRASSGGRGERKSRARARALVMTNFEAMCAEYACKVSRTLRVRQLKSPHETFSVPARLCPSPVHGKRSFGEPLVAQESLHAKAEWPAVRAQTRLRESNTPIATRFLPRHQGRYLVVEGSTYQATAVSVAHRREPRSLQYNMIQHPKHSGVLPPAKRLHACLPIPRSCAVHVRLRRRHRRHCRRLVVSLSAPTPGRRRSSAAATRHITQTCPVPTAGKRCLPPLFAPVSAAVADPRLPPSRGPCRVRWATGSSDSTSRGCRGFPGSRPSVPPLAPRPTVPSSRQSPWPAANPWQRPGAVVRAVPAGLALPPHALRHAALPAPSFAAGCRPSGTAALARVPRVPKGCSPSRRGPLAGRASPWPPLRSVASA